MELCFPLEEIAKHGYKVSGGETFLGIDQTAEIHVGVAEAKAVGGTAKGEQPTVGLYGADEALEELADVLFDGELLHRGEELDDEIEETLGEADDEALPG